MAKSKLQFNVNISWNVSDFPGKQSYISQCRISDCSVKEIVMFYSFGIFTPSILIFPENLFLNIMLSDNLLALEAKAS